MLVLLVPLVAAVAVAVDEAAVILEAVSAL